MEKFLDKLSSYHLLNNLLPGAVFCFLMSIYWDRNILSSNIIENIFIYYFIGIVISRVGSIIIEPICKKCNWVKYADYNQYISASKKDNKLDTLLETNNLFRTMFAMCLILLIGKLYIHICLTIKVIGALEKEIILLGLLLLFAFSYRKQTRYIKKRTEKIERGDEDELS